MRPAFDGPLTDQALDRLRTSAAMALAVPQLAVKLRVGDAVCLEVRRSPVPAAEHPVVPPCGFHRAVTGAFRMRRSGERIASGEVPPGCEPAIDWGVSAGAAIFAGGVVRIADEGRWRHVAAVLGSRALVAGSLAAVAPALGSGYDECLEVLLVHETTARDKAASLEVVGAIHRLMARVGVDDLEQRLALVPITGSRAAP